MPWLAQSVHRNSQRIRKRCTDTMETKGRTVDEKVRKGGGREEGVMDRWKRNRERKVRTKKKESENKVWQTGKYDNLFVNLSERTEG